MKNNFIYHGDSLEILKTFEDESVNMIITSPPYYNLRDYGCEGQIGNENTYEEYIENLIKIFNECKRVLKKDGSCWVNISDTYSNNNKTNIKKHSLIGIPDRFKIKMIDNGWICRNEIIWHKPNAMPSSAKTRFNNDYEKLFFFTKDEKYYFETQYEETKTNYNKIKNKKEVNYDYKKYDDEKQESSVRQGLNSKRGEKIIEVRNNLPSQMDFVSFIRKVTTIKDLSENFKSIKRTTFEHWFRKDEKGFSYPKVDDWLVVRDYLNDCSDEFNTIDYGLTTIDYESDDILKNIDKGRIKRAVWSINTKPTKVKHFAPYPKELIETPIKACCINDGIILDPFIGSGTTGIVALNNNKNFIGIELNELNIEIAKHRIEDENIVGFKFY